MADVKISALPAATTPLAGTELVPIVQGGVTAQVTVANMTAGRSVAASTVNVDANTSADAVRITQTGTGNAILVEDSANPDSTPFAVDADGAVLIGSTTRNAVYNPIFQIVGSGGPAHTLLQRSQTTAIPIVEHKLKSNGTAAAPTAVSSGDAVWRVSTYAYDGVSYILSAGIEAAIDAAPTFGSMPGRLTFSTTPTGAVVPVERLRINNAGNVGIGTTNPTALLNVVAGTSSDAVRITQTGPGNALVVEDGANPDATPVVIDSNGRFVVGYPTILTLAPSSAAPPVQLNVSVASTDFAATAASNWVAGAQGAGLVLAKSRSGVVGTPGIVAAGDTIGRVNFTADDGAKFLSAARVEAQVDGTPGLDDMPGRLVFSTTSDGTASPVERMRINNVGFVTVNGAIGRAAPSTQTGNFTLADNVNWVICNGAGTITITFPAASSWTGREVMIKTIAAQTVVSASANVVPLAGGAAGTAILPATAGAWATLVSDGTNWIIMQS